MQEEASFCLHMRPNCLQLLSSNMKDDLLHFQLLQLENLFLNLMLTLNVIYLGFSGVKSDAC